MINISGTYKTQHGDLAVAQNGDNVTATYQENGVCSGKLTGSVVEGIWKNKKDQGLFEWRFDDKGNFTGKYKSGLEKGPMRGKWNGKAVHSAVVEMDSDKRQKDTVEIILSGRVPKYFFGKVNESFQSELQEVLEFADESIEDVQGFLRLFLDITLENKGEQRETFLRCIPIEKFEERCPNLYALYTEVLEYDLDHFGLYESLFETAEYWAGGTGFISFFEDDCQIQILVNGEQIVNNKSFGEFSRSIKRHNTEETPDDELERKISETLKRFLSTNSEEFGLPEDIGGGINKEGVIFCETYFSPPAFEEICARDFSITIIHDDIIDYTYYLEVENFDLGKVLFLAHANYAEIRANSLETIANYMFYDNEVVLPDENWHRDKGIKLEFESRDTNLDFFLNG